MARRFPILLDIGRRRHKERERLLAFLGQSTCDVPWGLLEPHEAQAIHNHGQTLETLAARGGLGTEEMVPIIEGRGLRDVSAIAKRDATETPPPSWVALKKYLDAYGAEGAVAARKRGAK